MPLRVFSLQGTPGAVRPGDVASVYVPKRSEHGSAVDHSVLMTLGEARSWRFRTPAERPGVVMVESRVVGVHVYSKDGVLVDPLEALSNDEIRGLRGVCLETWGERTAERLSHLDPERACVKLAGEACRPDALAALPRSLRYLVLDNPRSTPLPAPSALNRLVFLKAVGNIDFSGLSACRDLAHLDLSFAWTLPAVALAELGGLRVLNLEGREDLELQEFAGGLRRLQWLNVGDSGVRDLAPLGSLPELHTVIADGTKVTALPEGKFPALRRLEVTRTGVSREQAARFMARHPDCMLSWSYTQRLSRALEGVDRIRVRTGGTCDEGDKDRTLFDSAVAAEVREIAASLEVEEPRQTSRCGCCGRPTLEFYRGGRRVVTLGIHHGRGLRWQSGEWSSDADLTASSGDFLCRWLSARGVPDPLEERSKR